jgi:acyl carrier protein
MERRRFLTLLDELLEFDSGTLQGNEQLKDLESWDSLAAIGYIALVDENYGKIVSASKLSQAQTINDLINLTE